MSAKISGKVWELELDPMDKLVLLALADHADHEGNNVRPGNDLLCAKTGLSQQTISAKITKFIEAGLLTPSTTMFGRGKKREFSIEPDAGTRHQYFIEKEERKVQGKRTFEKRERYKESVPLEEETYKQGVPLETERYKLAEEKVQADSEKVQADKILHDKERARVEPSIEPSIEPSSPTPSAQRKPNPFYEAFAEHYQQAYGCPYQNKKQDFIQLADCQKKGGDWLTADRWLIALGNYFASPLGNHTLADLSVRFGTFFRSALDRYGKPVATVSTGLSQKTQGNLAAAQNFLARHGQKLEDAA